MQYFIETAETHSKAMERIHAKYGDKVRILTHKSVKIPGFLGLFSKEGVEIQGYVSQEAPSAPRRVNDFEEEKKKILAQAKSDQATQQFAQLIKDVQSIKEKLDVSLDGAYEESRDHDTVKKLDEILGINDFTPEYKAELLARVRREFSLEELDEYYDVQDKVLEWIGDDILLYPEEQRAKEQKGLRVIVLVGPTGVGKTTTIAKLAFMHAAQKPGQRQPRVRIITIDNYRIGARAQMETYAGIMRIPFSSVETYDELKKTIDVNFDSTDVFLVDTIGKSPKDSIKLAEMKEILNACGKNAEPYLAMSAGTKAADLREIMRQFEPFGYRAVIATKMDETLHLGNILSVLRERKSPLALITVGQHVPNDIEAASVIYFLINLEGFRVNRLALEKRFQPAPESRLGK
jgi:flagellar biosynthesis protein FlhF